MEKNKKRKPGRPAQEGTWRFQVMLDPDSAAWGKAQPGGLSLLLRGLLREAHERAKKDLQTPAKKKLSV